MRTQIQSSPLPKILFHQDSLKITETELVFGKKWYRYCEIGAAKIRESRPYAWLSLVSLAAFLPMGLMLATGKITYGLYFPMTSFLISLLPSIGLVVFGFTHRVPCLFISSSLAHSGKTIEEVRAHIPRGLIRIDRHPSDEPCIVEVWF